MKSIPAGARPFADFRRPSARQRVRRRLRPDDRLPPFDRAPRPRSLGDVYWAARATLAPRGRPDCGLRRAVRCLLPGRDGVAAASESAPEERTLTHEVSPAALRAACRRGRERIGRRRPAKRRRSPRRRSLRPIRPRALERLARSLANLAPRRRGFRRERAQRGNKLDLRRSLLRPGRRSRPPRLDAGGGKAPARRSLLIDISGSMKAHTDDYLRFAHVLTQSLPAVETFSFGTRLTRLTKALRHKDIERALGEIAPAVADWSGGTRIGESLAAFLAIPRFSRASRGALVIVLSDGLERGDAGLMTSAVRRLAARSWRLAWLTPLAADPPSARRQRRSRRCFRFLDHLGDGSAIVDALRLCRGERRFWRHLPPAAGRSGIIHGNADHRRPSPHLAPRRPALARRADAAAHLRSLRADPPRLPDAEFLDDIAERRRREVGLRPGQLGRRRRPRTRSPGCRAIADETGWPHAIVGYADLMADDVRPAVERLARYRLHARHAHAAALAREPAIPLRRAARPRRRSRPSGRISPRSPSYGLSFDLQVFHRQMGTGARLAEEFPETTFILQHAGMLEDLSDEGPHGLAAGHGRARRAGRTWWPSSPASAPSFIATIPATSPRVVDETVGALRRRRCLFGSNFPIEKLWTDYGSLTAAYRKAFARHPGAERAMLHDVAARVYRLH